MTSAAYRHAAKVAGFIDKAENLGKRRARAEKGDHRKPPPGVKVISKEKLWPILLKRDGPNCMCGCGTPIDPNNWEDEHEVSLESVKHLPDAERAKYFLPPNRRAFCPGHQLRKNAVEAKVRAKVKRLAANPVQRPLAMTSDAKADRIRAREAAHQKAMAAKAGLA